ncbi:unnamed protein product, partial [marine sediment metagenome]
AISQFTSIRVNISPQQVLEGDQLRVPVSIIHVGAAETVTLYAAIGNARPVYLGGFDEILHGSERFSVPLDENRTARGEDVIIPITSAIRPGTYDVYAKITGKIPETISETVNNVIEVIPPEVVAPPELPKSEFRNLRITSYDRVVGMGRYCIVKAQFDYRGPEMWRDLIAEIGNYGVWGWDPIIGGTQRLYISESVDWHTEEGGVAIRITPEIDPKDSPYDIRAEFNGLFPEIISPVLENVV